MLQSAGLPKDRKDNVKWLNIILTIAAAAFLSSCKPKEIAGQVFIASESGTGIPFGSIEVRLIDAKEADDFVERKSVEVERKSAELQTNYFAFLKLQAAAQDTAKKIKAANDEYINNDSYTNEPEYLALVKESDDNHALFEKHQGTLESLKAKYGVPAERGVVRYSQEQLNAFGAEQYNMNQMQSLHERSVQIDREVNGFSQKINGKKSSETQTAELELERARLESANALAALENVKTASYFFAGFDPAPIESARTDKEGNFTLHNQKHKTKIFAKLRPPDSAQSLFWLVDLPPEGQKLVLSNNNVFSPRR
jgi:membrane-bound lytic murein transglycosylase B